VVYVDTQSIVYSVERHPDYAPLLRPLWQSAVQRTLEVITSELTLMEVLVKPIRSRDLKLQADYDRMLLGREIQLVPITQSLLREGARLRAETGSLRTPDALHAATAMLGRCVQFITNDLGFRQVPGLPVVLLRDLL